MQCKCSKCDVKQLMWPKTAYYSKMWNTVHNVHFKQHTIAYC